MGVLQPYERLEHELAEWASSLGGQQYMPEQVVVCSSGTAALHLALEALELPPGSEVLVPDYTMVACARAVTLAGLTPVFVDCDDRLLMDPHHIPRACDYQNLGPIRGVMPVHVYGRTCNMYAVTDYAGSYHLKVVEDLAEAHGVAPHQLTDAACWSFYRNKIIAGEEGGAVAFKDPAHAAVARELRSLGFTAAHDFRHRPRGHNYRLANCLAEKVLASLRRWEVPLVGRTQKGTVLEMRREAEAWYDDCHGMPLVWQQPPRDAPWVYDIRVPGLTRGKMAEAVRVLNAEGIEARMGFLPMSLQEEYCNCKTVGTVNSSGAANEVVYLPLTPGTVTRESAARSLEVIKSLVTS